MTAPNININKPTFGATPADADLTQLRDNIIWLMIAAAANGYRMPGWTTTVAGADPAELDSILLTQASLKMKYNFTWSSGNLATEIWEYDKGLGANLETLIGGTLTHSYDGSNNWTGTVPT